MNRRDFLKAGAAAPEIDMFRAMQNEAYRTKTPTDQCYACLGQGRYIPLGYKGFIDCRTCGGSGKLKLQSP